MIFSRVTERLCCLVWCSVCPREWECFKTVTLWACWCVFIPQTKQRNKKKKLHNETLRATTNCRRDTLSPPSNTPFLQPPLHLPTSALTSFKPNRLTFTCCDSLYGLIMNTWKHGSGFGPSWNLIKSIFSSFVFWPLGEVKVSVDPWLQQATVFIAFFHDTR